MSLQAYLDNIETKDRQDTERVRGAGQGERLRRPETKADTIVDWLACNGTTTRTVRRTRHRDRFDASARSAHGPHSSF